jgi:hypothetical protein
VLARRLDLGRGHCPLHGPVDVPDDACVERAPRSRALGERPGVHERLHRMCDEGGPGVDDGVGHDDGTALRGDEPGVGGLGLVAQVRDAGEELGPGRPERCPALDERGDDRVVGAGAVERRRPDHLGDRLGRRSRRRHLRAGGADRRRHQEADAPGRRRAPPLPVDTTSVGCRHPGRIP